MTTLNFTKHQGLSRATRPNFVRACHPLVWLFRSSLIPTFAVCLALAIIAYGFPPRATAQEGDAGKTPFFFIQMADPQLGMVSKNHRLEPESGRFIRAIAAANRLRPAFVVICGDLVNKPGGQVQITELQRICDQLDADIPLYLVSGNHDVENTPSARTLQFYRRTIGDDRYSFQHGGVYGIVLNSTIIKSPQRVRDEVAAQRTWLEAELQAADSVHAAHVIVFQHHSLFLEDPSEDDQYFNIARASRVVYLALFERFGVRAVFAGHYHRNATGRYGSMEMITTCSVGNSLGKDPEGFRIVKVYPDRIVHRYYGLDDMPETVRFTTD